MKKAIVLGCRDIGLGVIRALAAKNVAIMAIPFELFDFAHYSRFVATRTKRMPLHEENTHLLEFLLNLEKAWDRALIVATNDPSAVFIARNREALASRFIPATQGWDIIGEILNKARLYRHAGDLGVPVPRVLYPDTVDDLMHARYELTYPCILKPYETHKFFPVFHEKLFVINNPDELIEKFEVVRQRNLQIMISEIIPGADDHIFYYLSYLDRNGNIAGELCMQKLRQYPPGFGMARASRTVPMMQEIRFLALKLLKRFSYHGFSSVEFKYDRRDNKYKLMEINVRFELQERLFDEAGINFPYITYLDYVEGSSCLASAYEEDVYWIDLFRDVPALFKWRKRENWTFGEYLRPYMGKKVFCTPFFDDPLPFALKTSLILRHGLKCVAARTFKRE